MSVRHILDEKGRKVVTASPQMTVREVASVLHGHHIGAVIVVDGAEQIAGILTERDVVAAIATHGADCLDKPISSVMWSKVYSCTEETSINALMEIMSERRARHLPVEKNGQLVGIVSIGDAVKMHIRAIESEAEHIKAYITG